MTGYSLAQCRHLVPPFVRTFDQSPLGASRLPTRCGTMLSGAMPVQLGRHPSASLDDYRTSIHSHIEVLTRSSSAGGKRRTRCFAYRRSGDIHRSEKDGNAELHALAWLILAG